MLYGMADDLRWGLIGAIMAKTSPRRSLEFGKYASWRFLRLEALAKTSAASDAFAKPPEEMSMDSAIQKQLDAAVKAVPGWSTESVKVEHWSGGC